MLSPTGETGEVRVVLLRQHSSTGVLDALTRAAPSHQKRIIENAFAAGLLPASLQLPGARLKGIQLSGTHRIGLPESDLSGADLTHSRIWADLSGSHLRQARFTGSDLHGSRLVGANLTASNLSGTDCRGVVFSGSNLRGARLEGIRARLSDLSGCDLREASLAGADLSGTILRGSDLSQLQLRGAYLSGCSVSVAQLGQASLKPIRNRIDDLLDTYPAIVPVWMNWLRAGHWPIQQGELRGPYSASEWLPSGLSGLVRQALGHRIGAGWRCHTGGAEWIIWQFVRSIGSGDRPQHSAVAWWLYEWLRLRRGHHGKPGFVSRLELMAA